MKFHLGTVLELFFWFVLYAVKIRVAGPKGDESAEERRRTLLRERKQRMIITFIVARS